MPAITFEQEMTRDWDWFACDLDSHVAHFTTAGFRRLPRLLRNDGEALLQAAAYFFESMKPSSSVSIRSDLERDVGAWDGAEERALYLKSFVQAAERGAFSFDTELKSGAGARYYLVAMPKTPLTLADFTEPISEAITRIRAKVRFKDTVYLTEDETLSW